jgi:hypothetical protein
VRRIVPRTRALSVALSGGLLLYFTAASRLWRQELEAVSAELLAGWQEAAGARGGEPASLELAAGGLEPGVVLARTRSGRLLRSRDRGSTFAAEDIHASVLALDARADPTVALVETSAGRSLVTSRDGGASWQSAALDAAARDIAAAGAPIVAACGDVVALAAYEQGLALSTDGAATFSRVSGMGGVTAIAIGADRIIVALYHESDDANAIAAIDPASGRAEVIARLRACDFEESPYGTRVTALAWDSKGQRLLAAGGFGLVALSAPA